MVPIPQKRYGLRLKYHYGGKEEHDVSSSLVRESPEGLKGRRDEEDKIKNDTISISAQQTSLQLTETTAKSGSVFENAVSLVSDDTGIVGMDDLSDDLLLCIMEYISDIRSLVAGLGSTHKRAWAMFLARRVCIRDDGRCNWDAFGGVGCDWLFRRLYENTYGRSAVYQEERRLVDCHSVYKKIGRFGCGCSSYSISGNMCAETDVSIGTAAVSAATTATAFTAATSSSPPLTSERIGQAGGRGEGEGGRNYPFHDAKIDSGKTTESDRTPLLASVSAGDVWASSMGPSVGGSSSSTRDDRKSSSNQDTDISTDGKVEEGKSKVGEDDEDERENEEDEIEDEPKFQPKDRVWAWDAPGRGGYYEAVILNVARWGGRQSTKRGRKDKKKGSVNSSGKSDDNEKGWMYKVHWHGWNKRYDAWLDESCVAWPHNMTEDSGQNISNGEDDGGGGNAIDVIDEDINNPATAVATSPSPLPAATSFIGEKETKQSSQRTGWTDFIKGVSDGDGKMMAVAESGAAASAPPPSEIYGENKIKRDSCDPHCVAGGRAFDGDREGWLGMFVRDGILRNAFRYSGRVNDFREGEEHEEEAEQFFDEGEGDDDDMNDILADEASLRQQRSKSRRTRPGSAPNRMKKKRNNRFAQKHDQNHLPQHSRDRNNISKSNRQSKKSRSSTTKIITTNDTETLLRRQPTPTSTATLSSSCPYVRGEQSLVKQYRLTNLGILPPGQEDDALIYDNVHLGTGHNIGYFGIETLPFKINPMRSKHLPQRQLRPEVAFDDGGPNNDRNPSRQSDCASTTAGATACAGVATVKGEDGDGEWSIIWGDYRGFRLVPRGRLLSLVAPPPPPPSVQGAGGGSSNSNNGSNNNIRSVDGGFQSARLLSSPDTTIEREENTYTVRVKVVQNGGNSANSRSSMDEDVGVLFSLAGSHRREEITEFVYSELTSNPISVGVENSQVMSVVIYDRIVFLGFADGSIMSLTTTTTPAHERDDGDDYDHRGDQCGDDASSTAQRKEDDHNLIVIHLARHAHSDEVTSLSLIYSDDSACTMGRRQQRYGVTSPMENDFVEHVRLQGQQRKRRHRACKDEEGSHLQPLLVSGSVNGEVMIWPGATMNGVLCNNDEEKRRNEGGGGDDRSAGCRSAPAQQYYSPLLAMTNNIDNNGEMNASSPPLPMVFSIAGCTLFHGNAGYMRKYHDGALLTPCAMQEGIENEPEMTMFLGRGEQGKVVDEDASGNHGKEGGEILPSATGDTRNAKTTFSSSPPIPLCGMWLFTGDNSGNVHVWEKQLKPTPFILEEQKAVHSQCQFTSACDSVERVEQIPWFYKYWRREEEDSLSTSMDYESNNVGGRDEEDDLSTSSQGVANGFVQVQTLSAIIKGTGRGGNQNSSMNTSSSAIVTSIKCVFINHRFFLLSTTNTGIMCTWECCISCMKRRSGRGSDGSGRGSDGSVGVGEDCKRSFSSSSSSSSSFFPAFLHDEDDVRFPSCLGIVKKKKKRTLTKISAESFVTTKSFGAQNPPRHKRSQNTRSRTADTCKLFHLCKRVVANETGGSIESLEIIGDMAITAGLERQIRAWDIQTGGTFIGELHLDIKQGMHMRNLLGVRTAFVNLQITADKIISLTRHGVVTEWDLRLWWHQFLLNCRRRRESQRRRNRESQRRHRGRHLSTYAFASSETNSDVLHKKVQIRRICEQIQTTKMTCPDNSNTMKKAIRGGGDVVFTLRHLINRECFMKVIPVNERFYCHICHKTRSQGFAFQCRLRHAYCEKHVVSHLCLDIENPTKKEKLEEGALTATTAPGPPAASRDNKIAMEEKDIFMLPSCPICSQTCICGSCKRKRKE